MADLQAIGLRSEVVRPGRARRPGRDAHRPHEAPPLAILTDAATDRDTTPSKGHHGNPCADERRASDVRCYDLRLADEQRDVTFVSRGTVSLSPELPLMALEAVIDQALKLSVEERTELIERLLVSLDEAELADPGREAAWTEVLVRRLQEIREGRAETIDAAEALAQARAAARRR